jgi:hypothetical protein
MKSDSQIPEPFLFNPLKHHLGYLKEFTDQMIDTESDNNISNLTKELKHLGSSVTDVYKGKLNINKICREIEYFLQNKRILNKESFSLWTGEGTNDFRIISLSDGSEWTLKFHDNSQRFVHIFPARNSQHTFRVKANTLKSAILYQIIIGKDFIAGDDLNRVRTLLLLSPVKDTIDTEAIIEMIEIIRDSGSVNN